MPLVLISAIGIAAISRRAPRPALESRVNSNLPPVPRAVVEASGPSSVAERSIVDIVRALPDRVESLKEFAADWEAIEVALTTDPNSILPELLERYTREKDPAYKGLLAVLLAADPSTNGMIVADLRNADGKTLEFLRGFALYALVKNRSIHETYPGSTLQNLMRIVEYRRDELDREERADEIRLAWDLSGTSLLPSSGNAMMGPPRLNDVGAAEDSQVRDLLLGWPDGGPYWIERLVWEARKETALRNVDFAGQVFRKYLSAGKPEEIAVGLSVIWGATVHEHDLAAIADLARRPSEGDVLLERALWVIAFQRTATGEAHLRSLNRHFQSDDTRRVQVMEVMRLSAAQSYVDVGVASLSSDDARIRSEAIQILYYGDQEGSRTAIVQALLGDRSPLVRKQAAALIRWGVAAWGRASITAGEREALTWAVTNDVDPNVREEAQESLEAKRNMTKFKPDGTPYSVED